MRRGSERTLASRAGAGADQRQSRPRTPRANQGSARQQEHKAQALCPSNETRNLPGEAKHKAQTMNNNKRSKQGAENQTAPGKRAGVRAPPVPPGAGHTNSKHFQMGSQLHPIQSMSKGLKGTVTGRIQF